MSNDVLLSVKGLGLSVQFFFLQEIPFEEQPIIKLGLLEKKLAEAESSQKIKELRPRISRQSHEASSNWVPHFTRNSESMSFDFVTFGKKTLQKDEMEKFSPNFISKQKRFEKNEKNRLAKPKTKKTLKARRETGKAVASMVPSARDLDQFLKDTSRLI